MYLYELNGFYYIKDPIKEFGWLTESEKNPYFVLNNTTRKQFIQDILPLIKSGQCSYTTEALSKIKNFVQAPERRGTTQYTIVEPDPNNKPLKPHQIEAVSRMLKYPKYGFFLGTGTGKTLIAISFLMTLNLKRALIVTTKTVLGQYQEELDKYIPGNNHLVINYEQASKYIDESFDAVILDESHKAKGKGNLINTTLKQITSKTPNVYLFTGSPQDKLRHDIFAQLYLLYTHFMPGKTRFLNRYFHLNDYYQPTRENQQFSNELTEMIQSITWGKETEEVIDLSNCPIVEHEIICDQPHSLYNTLIKDRVYEFPYGASVVADTPANLRTKLREICSGFVRIKQGTKTGIQPLTNTKNKPTQDCLEKLPQALIFTEFKWDCFNVSGICNSLKASYAIIDGSTKKKDRDRFITQFKNGTLRFLIVQNQSGNAGLDLPCTNNVVWYTLPDKYINFSQGNGRIRRQGQTKECNYYYVMCKNSIEIDILKSLKKKKNYTNRVFKIYS